MQVRTCLVTILLASTSLFFSDGLYSSVGAVSFSSGIDQPVKPILLVYYSVLILGCAWGFEADFLVLISRTKLLIAYLFCFVFQKTDMEEMTIWEQYTVTLIKVSLEAWFP